MTVRRGGAGGGWSGDGVLLWEGVMSPTDSGLEQAAGGGDVPPADMMDFEMGVAAGEARVLERSNQDEGNGQELNGAPFDSLGCTRTQLAPGGDRLLCRAPGRGQRASLPSLFLVRCQAVGKLTGTAKAFHSI